MRRSILVSFLTTAAILTGCGSVEDALEEADKKVSDGLKAARTLEGQLDAVNDSVAKYKVMAQSILDSAAVVVSVGPDGTFRIDSIGGKPIAEVGGVVLSILDGESNLAGVVTAANSIGLDVDSVPSQGDGTLDLGKILLDTARNTATMADSLDKLARPDYSIASNAQADLGAVATSSTVSDPSSPLDRDHDGMPDLFDADAGNNGILDAFEDQDSTAQILRKLPGEVRRFVRETRVNSVFLPVAGAPPLERQRSYLIQLHLRPTGTAPIDSVLIEGPSWLDSCEWKSIAAPGTPGDNRLVGRVRRLSSSNPSEGWHAELQSPTGALFRQVRMGDLISFRVFSQGRSYLAFEPITWLFRETPMLIRYAQTIGGSLQQTAYADSMRLHPPMPGTPPWKPVLATESPLRLEIDLMRLRTPLRNGASDSIAGIASLATFLKDNRYVIEFWTEGATYQLRNRTIEGPVRVDAAGDSVGWRFFPAAGKAVILVPKSYLRTMDNRTESAPLEAVARYKIDLSMWDRLGNKTSLQVLFDRAP